MLYRNWLRGLLGSADSETAKKYGMALYDARSLKWDEVEEHARPTPRLATAALNRKKDQWEKVAEQIKQEDPEAYEYLQGVNGMDRIGAGFIAMLAAFMFAMFDLTASMLVLLGFLIFRWAVIAAPILGTVGLLRPASAGIRRLGNAVVAAIFNIAIFGTGAAIYLFAVDLIMNTASLPGWLQVVLVWLCGVVGWLLLRPYRRITQLGGKDGTRAIASAGSWHRRFFRDMREAAKLEIAEGGGTREPEHRQGQPNRLRRPEQLASRGTSGGSSARDRGPRRAVRANARTASQSQIRPDGNESASRRRSSLLADTPTHAVARAARSSPRRTSGLDRTRRGRAASVLRDLPTGDRQHHPGTGQPAGALRG